MSNRRRTLKRFSRTFSLVCFLCVINVGLTYEPQDGNNSSFNDFISEGSPCHTPHSGLDGICRRVTQCLIAIDALKKGRNHELLRCGFVGDEEVVCCPEYSDRNVHPVETSTLDSSAVWSDTTTKPSTNNGGNNKGRIKVKRKCELMCEKIYKDNNIKPEIEFYVLNGDDAKVGQFPHMAALGFLDADDKIDWRKCGAALISSRFLLTAAHCVVCNGCNDPVKVRFGVVDVTDDSSAQDIDVKNVFTANYNITTRHNDIAVVELVKDVQMSKQVYPACLYTEADDPQGLRVTGWGQTEQGNLESRSNVLQFATIEPVSVDQCNTTILSKNKYTSKIILPTQICAISRSDACAGDSGGPIQIQKKQGGYDIVGVVSYGVSCGTSIPGIYTRVSAYLEWIEEKVWPT